MLSFVIQLLLVVRDFIDEFNRLIVFSHSPSKEESGVFAGSEEMTVSIEEVSSDKFKSCVIGSSILSSMALAMLLFSEISV